MKTIVIRAGGRTLVYCQVANRGRGEHIKLRKARKYNNGGWVCEHCPVRQSCNRPPSTEK